MVSTWIEAAAKGRHGGPVRAGIWSACVIGTHPIEANQEVWLELVADEVALGPLPAYWVENKGVNSLWHVPIPPQAVNARLHYRSVARRNGSETVVSGYQDTIVRPNLPDRIDAAAGCTQNPEGLVGNREMTVRIDRRGSTFDVYYPSVGLHSDIRPAAGDQPRSRSHFRSIVGGLAIGRRLDWFNERASWEVFQHYQGATNLLMTELTWRNGPIRVWITDFVAMGDGLPRTAGGTTSPGQYLKRFLVENEGLESRRMLFGVYIQPEVNGGIGEPGLSWHDGGRTLLATNRGHSHANRKLARDATVEFAIALDDRGEVHCEPTGPNEAVLLRSLEVPAGGSVSVDLLVSGAFTGWRGDPGTYEHWLKPALSWFRSADLDHIEQTSALAWDAYVEPLPSVYFPKAGYAVSLRRSALAAALHADATWGAIASGYDRGLNAYCWPREAVFVGATFDRAGHPEIGRAVYQWLSTLRAETRPFLYWFQKYSIDGSPEWETPSVDQSALIPWGLERHVARTGDLELLSSLWPMVEQASHVAEGNSLHPGLRWIEELKLVSSAGVWDNRYGAFLFSNACCVAGLNAASRLAERMERPEAAQRWRAKADLIWNEGILPQSAPGRPEVPGLVDAETGRFLEARRVSTLRGLWTEDPSLLIDRSLGLDVSILALAVPLGLLPASDPRLVKTAEAMLRRVAVVGDQNAFSRWAIEPGRAGRTIASGELSAEDVSSLATLWMARYLIALGRETGQARYWSRALAIVDGVLLRLLPLGLSFRNASRGGDPTSRGDAGTSGGVWALHAAMVETLLDFAGLDYQALDRVLTLEPVLPSAWPQTGQSQTFACGEVLYRLERPIGGDVHQLTLRARLAHSVRLSIGVTCPGLTELGPWRSSPDSPPPTFNPRTGRLSWALELPEGESSWRWTWG